MASGEAFPFADFDWCRRLAKFVANSTRQRIDEESPLLSAALPSGERIQIVLPPATTGGSVAFRSENRPRTVWSSRSSPRGESFARARRSSGGAR